MSGGSRPGGATSSRSPSSASSQAPPPAPETLTRRSGVPAGARCPVAANASGSHRSNRSANAMSVGGRSQLVGSASICAFIRTILRGADASEPSRRGWAVRSRWRVLALPLVSRRRPRARRPAIPELRPTRGPYITDAARAGDADATAVELNPGALGFLPAAGARAGRRRRLDPAVVPGRGVGAYLGLPVFLRSALGFGLSRVAGTQRRRGSTPTRRCGSPTRCTSCATPRSASPGRTSGRAPSPATDTFDFGLSARRRPLRRARRDGRGRRRSRTRTPSAPALPRLWTAELVLRPLGTDRLEVALGAAHADGDGWDRLVPRARLSVTVIDGLRLYAEGESVPRGDGAGASAAAATRGSTSGWRSTSIISAARSACRSRPRRRRGGAGIAGARPPRRRAPPGAGRARLRRARQAARGSTTIAPSSSWCAGCARWPSIRPSPACCSRSRGSPSATGASRSCATWWRSCARTASERSPT